MKYKHYICKTQKEIKIMANSVLVNFVAIRNSVAKFLKGDKSSGIKKAWYYHHVDMNQNQAIDTRKDFLDMVSLYESQGILPYKVVIPSRDALKRVGAQSVKLHVYRKDGAILQRANNEGGEYVVDEVAVAFDYLPADCEIVIAEVQFVKS